MVLIEEDSMAIWGYVRVSTHEQTPETQKLIILEYANQHHLVVDHWIETIISSRKSPHARRIDELLHQVQPHDTVIVSELSRLGRSVGQIAMIVDALLSTGVSLIALKEQITLDTHLTLQKKVMMTMFSLFAEIERDLISQRTKEGLARSRAEGKLLGRPKGKLGKSKLDGKEQEIQGYVKKGVNLTNIARIYDVSRSTIQHFITTRKL